MGSFYFFPKVFHENEFEKKFGILGKQLERDWIYKY